VRRAAQGAAAGTNPLHYRRDAKSKSCELRPFSCAGSPEPRTSQIAFASIRKGRGPNKAPTKKLVSLRLSREVINHFKSAGPGWQSRIDETLRKAVKRKAS
jgi:uncharacterized protein (DUF4415 family)